MGGGKGPNVTAGSAGFGCIIPAILSWKGAPIESYRVLAVLKLSAGRRNCQEILPSFMTPNVVKQCEVDLDLGGLRGHVVGESPWWVKDRHGMQAEFMWEFS